MKQKLAVGFAALVMLLVGAGCQPTSAPDGGGQVATNQVRLQWTAAAPEDDGVSLTMHWTATGPYNTAGTHTAGRGISQWGGYEVRLNIPANVAWKDETIKMWVDPLGHKDNKWTCALYWPGHDTVSHTANAVACSNH